MSEVLISCTVSPAIRRRLASPEAVTRSKPPAFISETISSELPAVFTVTLQPVAFSKPVTQSYAGSDSPRSMYPGHATIETSPSPAPMAVNISALAVWAARTMAATVAVSLMLWDMLPPRVFPVQTFAESAMVGTDPRPDRASRHTTTCRTLTDRSTVACPKLNVKPGKRWNLMFQVHE